MAGVSLGVRTSASYGSLPQQVLNGGLQTQNLYIPRRPSRAILTGSREKERYFPSAFRYLSQKKVGMLILLVFAFMAFMAGFFTANKEDYLDTSALVFDLRYPNKSSVISNINKVIVRDEPSSLSSLLDDSGAGNSSRVATSFIHPCKGFAFPPPPPGGRRRLGPRPCPVCYVTVEQAIALMPTYPSASPVLRHLSYFSEENPLRTEPVGGSQFGGYPSLEQRNDSFNMKESMTVHCGFVKGCKPGVQTGFNIDESDLELFGKFYEVIVASAIFGNYDVIQQPRNIGETARVNVPFFMFIDEETEAYMKNTSLLNDDRQVGLWRIIVVHNLPYTDARRNGKVPKLLLHRLFPNVRYSIWIDGKLELVVDPYQILERFLWRQNATFAISRHYSRFDVFEEAEANKAAAKYDNVSIDYQIEFYKEEGLTPYTMAKLPITSDVPEGCVLIREHIAITNLFSCLWFNEVDRFTSRDQLSFSTVRDKIRAQVNWTVDMFLDCERRNFVIQAYHRDLLEQRAHMAVIRSHSPPAIVRDRVLPRKSPIRRGRDKKPGSRRHRRVAKNRDNSYI